MNIEIQITAGGGVAMLHDDAVNLGEFGEVNVKRASNVEWSDGLMMGSFPDFKTAQPVALGWYVQSARTGYILRDGFSTRADALAWEKSWYSPSGRGWAELTEGN